MPNLILGTSKDDVLKGKHSDDLIYGLAGHDTIDGGAGSDVISGGGRDLAMAPGTRLAMGEDYAGSVTFAGENAGYLSTIGMYEIAADGTISNVSVLFANGSAKGSGGSLVAGTSAVAATFKAGVKYGFFIVPDGYSSNGKTLNKAGTYVLKTASGAPANVNAAGPLILWHRDAAGFETKITGAFNGETFHSLGAPGEGVNLNSDGLDHARIKIDPATGTLTIAFEDVKGGGDKDFDDAVITVNVGLENALGLADSETTGNGGNDKLSGGDGDDTILGMSGNDTAWGGNGNDKLWGNTGNDTLYGDAGDDVASGGEGTDEIYGGIGNDKLSGNTGADKVWGDDGNDTINGNDGDDVLAGGVGNDTVYGGKGVDTLAGDAGDDKLYGDTGNDKVSGGDGKDSLVGGDGDDVLDGGIGNDTAAGGKGNDGISGDAGDDKLYGDTGHDKVSGGDGNDSLLGGDGDDALAGDGGDDSINGGKGNDKISDGDGSDKVDGDSGDDWIMAGAGDDSYVGGSGVDTLDFSAYTGVKVDLLAHTASGAGNDKISGVENVIGSAGDDVLTGDSLANLIVGGDGNDLIKGGRGSDVLTGGLGNDTFVWGSGKDATGENGKDAFVDTITDFEAGDVLDLRALPDLKAGQSVASLVALRVEDGSTIVSAAFGAGGAFVDVAVLKGVTGLAVESLYADGSLLV
jgi:Ca2+-binding RTX toxin-like protein